MVRWNSLEVYYHFDLWFYNHAHFIFSKYFCMIINIKRISKVNGVC